MTLARLGAGMRFMGRDGGHGLDILPDPRFTQVSRHLLWGGPHTCSNFYVLLSESGKACFSRLRPLALGTHGHRLGARRRRHHALRRPPPR